MPPSCQNTAIDSKLIKESLKYRIVDADVNPDLTLINPILTVSFDVGINLVWEHFYIRP